MPDKNKLAVFSRTGMTIFKTCSICRYGEIQDNGWGLCKHPGHFFDHLKHGRHVGVSHASMGCEDFEMVSEQSKIGIILGIYSRIIPVLQLDTEDVGMDDSADQNTDDSEEDEVSSETCALTGSAVTDAHTESEVGNT